jgi:hypothetical protein
VREFQLEFVSQKLRKTALDLLCFGLRSGELEEMVIAISHVTQPPKPRICGVLTRQCLPVFDQCAHRGAVPASALTCELLFHLAVFRVGCPALTSGVFGNENVLDKPVQLEAYSYAAKK